MVFVDELRTYDTKLRWKTWCHMFCTGNAEELHSIARSIGLKREWFQQAGVNTSTDHYDLIPTKRILAIKHGAVAVSQREGAIIRMYFRGQKVDPARVQEVFAKYNISPVR